VANTEGLWTLEKLFIPHKNAFLFPNPAQCCFAIMQIRVMSVLIQISTFQALSHPERQAGQ